MKSFKTYLLGLFLMMGALFASTSAVNAQYTVNLTPSWQQVGQKCFSCGSAHFLIYNETVPRNGWYYSYVYVWSNSYDSRGTLTNTYITRPRISMLTWQGEMELASSYYFLAYPQNDAVGFNGWNLMFTVWSSQPGSQYVLRFDALDDY